MPERRPRIPPLFVSDFRVDYSAPFRRHLNRLEVEIGREDYRHLKRVELLEELPSEAAFRGMEEITGRLLKTTQNNYNRDLLSRLNIRVYLDPGRYEIYYRLPDRCLRFVPAWRHKVLTRLFRHLPVADTDWHSCRAALPGFEARFLPDQAGGVLLLRGKEEGEGPLLTATHGPYDPHTLEVAFYFLRTGKGGAALVNLGFSGREPLTDENLAQLTAWGVPLNPSNIDVIYPYVDPRGHPYAYKLEEGLVDLARALGRKPPTTVIDLHGCVGTLPDDRRVVVGLGGLPPFQEPGELGELEERGGVLHLGPHARLREGLALLRDLSDELYVQFCAAPHRCYNFVVLGKMQMLGRQLDPSTEIRSLLPGEQRTYLPAEDIRWLPGAGGNALQRREARKLRADALCLHVEIPTAVRRRMVLRLRALEIGDSLDASSL